VIIFTLLVLTSSVSFADPTNVFTLDDVVKVTVEGADEAICCKSYSITVTVKALQDVRIREFDVEVYCVSDCCEQKVYDSTLLTDYDMSSSSSKSWTISVKCCCVWCCDDAWIKVKIWILYNFTNTRIDNATLSFYLVPVFPISYCDLYSSYINLKNDYEDLKEDYEDLKDVYEDLLAEYTSLSSAYNQLLAEKTSLELEVEALQNTIEDLKSKLNSTKSELARVRSALEDAQRELSEKEYALERLRSEYDALSSDFNACESRYLSLLKEHEALKTEYKETVSELVVLRVSLALGLLGLALIILAKYVLPGTFRSP